MCQSNYENEYIRLQLINNYLALLYIIVPMKFVIFYILFFYCTHPYINTRLISVVNIFRHGARTPINHFELVNDLFSPLNQGEVTPNGLRQHYLLGRYLRQRYIENPSTDMNLLKRSFLKNDVKIFSQNLQRTINSAVAHLSGLFKIDLVFSEYQEYIENSLQFSNPDPPILQNDESFSKNHITKITNTKFLIIDQKTDKVLSPRECFRLERAFDKTVFELSEEEKVKIISMKSMFPNQIEKIIESNFNIRTIKKLLDLIVTTNYHYRDHFPIATDVMGILQKYWLKYSYQEKISDNDKKLLVSSFFQTIINNFDNFIYHCQPFKKFIKDRVPAQNEKFFKHSKDDCVKMMIFSGRDTSLVDIISNLLEEQYINSIIDKDDGFAINYLIPKFASSLIFELHYDEKQYKYYVKLLYNGEENIKAFRMVFGKNVVYSNEKGILYEDFKLLLLSRINNEYIDRPCGDSIEY